MVSKPTAHALSNSPFSDDELRVVAIVRRIEDTSTLKGMKLAIDNEDAHRLLDELQLALEAIRDGTFRVPHTINTDPSTFRRRAIRLLVKLCKRYGAIPQSLFLTGVECSQKLDPISSGGFADIFVGNLLSKRVALKRVRLYASNDKGHILQTICQEAILWRQFDHPNIVPFLGVDRQTFGNTYAIVTPWMENGNMLQYIKKRELSLYMTLLLLEDASRGLHYLHEHDFVHGDLRAANVLVDDNRRACLTDFGLTFVDNIASLNGSTVTGHNNARWLPLEMLNESENRPQYHTDVFSFGRVMLEACTLRPPFPSKTDVQVAFHILSGHGVERPTFHDIPGREIPDWLWNLMQWCWSSVPTTRPTAYDVLNCLESSSDPVKPRYNGLATQPDEHDYDSLTEASRELASSPSPRHNRFSRITASVSKALRTARSRTKSSERSSRPGTPVRRAPSRALSPSFRPSTPPVFCPPSSSRPSTPTQASLPSRQQSRIRRPTLLQQSLSLPVDAAGSVRDLTREEAIYYGPRASSAPPIERAHTPSSRCIPSPAQFASSKGSVRNGILAHPRVLAYMRAHRGRFDLRFGPYILLETIHRHGSWKVKSALHGETGRKVAIRLVKKADLKSPTFRRRVEQEVDILGTLVHPSIVAFHGVEETETFVGLALDHDDPRSLTSHVLARGYLTAPEARKLFSELISGIWYMHQKRIVHGNLTLESVALNSHGDITIGDFSSALVVSHGDDLVQPHARTPIYAAPELVATNVCLGAVGDVWSCGVILYAMLAGRLPWSDGLEVDVKADEEDDVKQLYRFIACVPAVCPGHVEDDAEDLVLRILIANPLRRADVRTVMEHRWLERSRRLFDKSVEELEKAAMELRRVQAREWV